MLPAAALTSDLDTAARYLRYSEEALPVVVPATTHWAKLARYYAQLQRLDNANDYEALLPVLQELAEYLPPPA